MLNISRTNEIGMGGSSSKDESNVEGNSVQNNISFGKTMEVHNRENSILLGIICAIKILEILIYLFKSFRRSVMRNLSSIDLSKLDSINWKFVSKHTLRLREAIKIAYII